ncbi:hypothetical protein EFP97_09165 [Lactobacillus helveticus]|nr:hypothetical protein AY470_07410 [Lactobacillus helveticus]KXN79664.1 hypothetical protein AY471_06070 [Lactobacillus helveticus]MCT3407213.1 hypothetical protein [Lactobacillus helveticus]MCT3413082.1 hypothetical protein [Lactobacillus helveticus]MCT3416088.1 hypothetical protein [Lactobacillus helveticus]
MCKKVASLKSLRSENRGKSEQVFNKSMFIQYFWKNGTSNNLNRKNKYLLYPNKTLCKKFKIGQRYQISISQSKQKKLSNFAERSK